MVFLRLEVKVFPREQAPSSPGLFRSLMGSNGDRARDEVNAPKKFASFLLAVEKPEDLTLGDLACMILDEWRVLRPDQEPLAIKKLLDDANPSVDLNVGLTVEDVFVDRGKARADGHDQRATVRVIQKPTAHCPERFPSVLQDWEGAVQESKRRRSKTKKEIAKQFSPVLEEDAGLEDTVMQDSPIEQRHRDLPVPSVEAHETTTAGQQEPHSDAIAGTPPLNGLGSEELGSPSPPERQQRPLSQSRKRKQSPEEEEAPVKNPRLEENTRSTQQLAAQSLEPAAEIAPASAPSPLRKRNRIPSFASPHRRRPSISEKPADVHKPGLGLGITKSPSTARTVMLDMPSSQTSLGAPLFPSSAPTAPTLLDQDHGSATKQSQSLQSAMRKNTPVSKSHQRRSVSFANGNDIAQEFQEPQSTPQDGAHLKPSQNTPTDSGTPSSSQIVYPPGFSEEKIQKIRAQVEQEAREIESVNNKLKDPNTDPRCLSPLRQLSDLFAEIKSREGRGKDTRKLRDLRKKLAGPRKKIQMIQKEASEKDSPPSTEPPLPPSASKVDRSIPVTTVNAPSGLDTTPTWSFGSTGKAQSNRRSSVASSNGTHEATSSQHAQPDTSRQKTSENSEAQSTPSASKSPALASRSSPRKPPVKADLQPTPSVMIHTTPLRAPTEASAERQTSRSPAKQREIIEVPSTDDEDDEDEDEDEQDDEEGGNVQNGGKNEQDEQDEDERGEDDEMAERKPATEDQAQELPNEPTKEPVQSLIDDQAEEQDDDEEEEGKEQEDEDEDEDESSGESSDEGEGDKDEAEDGANGVEEQDSDYKDDDDEEGSGSELDLPPLPSQSRSAAKSPAQVPSQPPSSQRTPTVRTTLKGLLQSQKAEQAARQKQPQPAAPQPPAKRDVYEVPSSSESESESDSDSDSDDSKDGNSDQENLGDILPNGDSGKLRRPYSLRK